MHHPRSFVFVFIALIAQPSLAAIFPRQGTVTSTSSTASASNAGSPTSATALPSTVPSALSMSSNVPVVSVESGGVLTTIIPTGTSLSPSATGLANSTSGSNSTVPAPPACIPADYDLNGALAPFCEPKNGTGWIKNNTYAITWDPNFWPGYQGKVAIALLYTGQDGSNVITQNDNIENQGFYSIGVNDDWLNGNQVVAARFLIVPNEATSKNGGAHYGPIVILQVSATPFDTSPPKFDSKNLAVVIAVPVSVVAFLIFLCGVCYCTRKQRRLPEGLTIARNGRSSRGYAEGRSRRKRTGIEKTPDEFELGTVSGYRDEPTEVYSDLPEHSVEGIHRT